MERVSTQQLAMMPIEFKLNGQTVVGRPDEPIIRTAKKHGINIPHLCHGGEPRFEARLQPKADISHPAIAVNLDACIQCTRCVRACREVQVNDVIGYAYRGDRSVPVFDFDDPMGESTCVACGECVQACPTGALMPARGVGLKPIEQQVDSVCPFCGVGCRLTYHGAAK